MSGYRKSLKVEVEIDGVVHAVAIRPLTFADSIAMYSAGEAAGKDGSPEHARAQRLCGRERMADAVLSIEPPILDADGAVVTAQEFCAAAYFHEPVRKLYAAWMEQSQPSDPTSPAASSGDGQKA